MIRRIPSHAAALAVFFALGGPAGAAVSSDFASDAQGWDVVTSFPAPYAAVTPFSATYNPAGGNPGGYISILDPDSNDTFFRAPAAYLGNQSAVLGGTLRFDRIIRTSALDYNSFDVVLKGGGITLLYDIPTPTLIATWETIGVTLAPGAGWTNGGIAATAADFQTVLGSLTDLWLLAEFTTGLLETTGIDNVSLAEAVPEPGTLLLLFSALGMAGLARRRAA